MRDRTRTRWSGRASALGSCGVALVALAASPALRADEQPPGCNANSVGTALIPTIGGAPVPPGQCVIPGQAIDYMVSVFVSPNSPAKPDVVYCDVMGGQLSVTFPDFNALPLRPGQYVRVAGFPDTPVTQIPQFGNPDGANLVFTQAVPATYVVDPDHADMGLLNARVDYGQTAYLDLIGQTQEPGIVLSDPTQEGTASITNALVLCLPDIRLEKTFEVGLACEGVPTPVTYLYAVENVGAADLTDVLLVDDTCGPVVGPLDDDGDGLLSPGEVWHYTCADLLSTTTTNVATVTALAVAPFPPGQVVDGVVYSDSAEATVSFEICEGACCFPDGSCSELTQQACDAADGDYQGDGTDCMSVVCPGPTGACCLPDGSCLADVTALQCEQADGEFQGNDTQCADVVCDRGACCLPDNHPQAPCVETTEPRCIVLGGDFQGIGESCDDPFICSDFPGACCLGDGSCIRVIQEQCDQFGGDFQGPTTSCEVCFLPGACCLPDGSCFIVEDVGGASCAAMGGDYQGDATTCAEAACPILATSGCSDAYWRHQMHLQWWPAAYPPDTPFGSVFENAFPGLTLLEVLHLGSGSLQQAARQAVAALLNAASPDVDSGLSPEAVVSTFNGVYPGNGPDYAQLANSLGALNAVGCPLNGDLPSMPIPSDDGESPYDTYAAVTEGGPLPPTCDEGGGVVLTNDIWRLYTAPVSRAVSIVICDSDYDTRLAVYEADGDLATPLACSDDACGVDGRQSRVTVQTTQGSSYLLRIGGREGMGSGMLVIGAACAGDVNQDGQVDVDDLVTVIVGWGPCPTACPGDVDQSGAVDVDDLVQVVLAWGDCPD